MGGFEVNYSLQNFPLLPREYGITGNWWIYSGWVGESVWEVRVKEREDLVDETNSWRRIPTPLLSLSKHGRSFHTFSEVA